MGLGEISKNHGIGQWYKEGYSLVILSAKYIAEPDLLNMFRIYSMMTWSLVGICLIGLTMFKLSINRLKGQFIK